jgi:hypothetical protein
MKPMTTDDTYNEYLHQALMEQIKRLNETKPGMKVVEAVMAEFGYERMTTAKLEEIKKEIGL